MTEIILGYERFSDTGIPIEGYNGRYLPNSVTYPNDIVEKYGYPINVWFKEVIIPEKLSQSEISNYFLFSGTSQPVHENKLVSEISIGVKYFYPIIVKSIWLYSNFVSEISINPKVRNDVLMNNAVIVFIYTTEGNSTDHLDKFSDLIRTLDLPKSNIFFLHGDLEVSNYISEPFTYVPVFEMHWWLSGLIKDNLVADLTQIEKLFLSYNRTLRTHKILFLAQLTSNELLDKGIISAGNLNSTQVENTLSANNVSMDKKLKDRFLSLSNISPDNRKFPDECPAQETTIDHYHKTFLTVTVETLESTLFFSEKTFKPILHKHPFILLGKTGMLRQLKSFGFRTFDKWWDESYDDALTMNERIEKIIQVLTRLNRLNISDYKNLRKEMEDVLEYNSILLRKMCNDKGYNMHTEILTSLLKIKNNLWND